MNQFFQEKIALSSWLSTLQMSEPVKQQLAKTEVRLEKISKLAQWVSAAPLATRAFWQVSVFLCSSMWLSEKTESKRKLAVQSYVRWKKRLHDGDGSQSYANPTKNEFVIGLKGIQDNDFEMFFQLKKKWTTTELFSFVYFHELGHVLQSKLPRFSDNDLYNLAKPLPSLVKQGLDGEKLNQFFNMMDALIEKGVHSQDKNSASFFKETQYCIKSLWQENFADVFSVLMLAKKEQNIEKFRLPLSESRKAEAYMPDTPDKAFPYILDHCTTDALEALPVVLKDINQNYKTLSIDECIEVAKYCTLIGVCRTLSRLMNEPAMVAFMSKPELLFQMFGDTVEKETSLPSLLSQACHACIPKGVRHKEETLAEWFGINNLSPNKKITKSNLF